MKSVGSAYGSQNAQQQAQFERLQLKMAKRPLLDHAVSVSDFVRISLALEQAIARKEISQSRRRDARGAIDLSRLLGSELRWHARIDSCC
jgi:hypothetical protein